MIAACGCDSCVFCASYNDKCFRQELQKIRTHILCAWIKLNDGQLHNLFDLPDNIGVIHFGRIRWAGLVARMEEKRNAYRVLVT